MSIATLVLGSSGTGKSTSLQHLDPSKTLLIQCINKPLPFRSKDWKIKTKEDPEGNVFRTDDPMKIVAAMTRSTHEVVVVDDFQAAMVNILMARSEEKSYDKFSSIGKGAWEVFRAAGSLAEHRRAYIMAHTQTDDVGNIRMKTVGKMVDQTLVPEGYFTIVLRTEVINGRYLFSTQTNGMDCCKSPINMFADQHIDNDLNMVDNTITEFYGITNAE